MKRVTVMVEWAVTEAMVTVVIEPRRHTRNSNPNNPISTNFQPFLIPIKLDPTPHNRMNFQSK